MKNVLLLLIFALFGANLSAQTATSTANGSWLNPLNWDCFCVPLPGYTITISHAITLNTDFAYTSGSITISAAGSLIQDATPRNIVAGRFRNRGIANFNALLINVDSVINESTGTMTLVAFSNYNALINQGTIHLDSFYNDKNLTNTSTGIINARQFFNDATFENSGLINVDSFYNNGLVHNDGTIGVSSFYNADEIQNHKNIHQIVNSTVVQVDSLTNAGLMVNHLSSTIKVDSILNTGTFYNYGFLSFGDFTNWGTTHNFADMNGVRSFWNDAQFDNHLNATMTLGASFYNGDTLGTIQIADFKNNGSVTIGDSWFSTDTVSGSYPGSFRIQNITSNAGNMLGSYDFCDLTPPPTAPFVDFNIGNIDNTITYCTAVSIQQIPSIGSIHIYPNPVQNQIVIEINSNEYLDLQLVNSLGQIVLQQKIKDKETVSLGNLSNGIYWVRVLDKQERVWAVERVVKI